MERNIDNKNIVVLGGGTAGWLTALFMKKCLPDYNVTVVRSKEKSIIGVGEATTPIFTRMLNQLDIDVREVVVETNGTVKNGISFENWNGDGKKYFHGFNEKIRDFVVKNVFSHDCFHFYLQNAINQKLDFNECTYSAKVSYENKIDLGGISYALHFDTNLLSQFLEKKAILRSINVINGEFKEAVNDENDFITSIILEDGQTVPVDFIFDCSGLARLLIGKHYNSTWKSYSKHLPMKKAIPFYLPYGENLPPYTQAIAMKYGWCWKIPLKHRYGCGYVFDSDYIDEEQALQEVKEFFNTDIQINRVIDFDAGKYETFWVKNCIALGLASSFIEPLESTSIHITCMQLFYVLQFLNELKRCNDKSIKLFNGMCNSALEDTLNFVYLHYLTKRNDTDFWRDFRSKHPVPEGFVEQLELIKGANIRVDNIPFNSVFSLPAFLQVANGLGIFEKDFEILNYENLEPSIEHYKQIMELSMQYTPDHKESLNRLVDELELYRKNSEKIPL
jgi:tryptophan halogenase